MERRLPSLLIVITEALERKGGAATDVESRRTLGLPASRDNPPAPPALPPFF